MPDEAKDKKVTCDDCGNEFDEGELNEESLCQTCAEAFDKV